MKYLIVRHGYLQDTAEVYETHHTDSESAAQAWFREKVAPAYGCFLGFRIKVDVSPVGVPRWSTFSIRVGVSIIEEDGNR